MARLTCRMRNDEIGRGKRSPRRDFLSVVMKWPCSRDGPGSPSLRAQIARWLDRPHLGCRTERSEWNRLVRLNCGSRATLPGPNGAPAGFPASRSRSRRAGEVRHGCKWLHFAQPYQPLAVLEMWQIDLCPPVTLEEKRTTGFMRLDRFWCARAIRAWR
jgi:hypothetical protein